MEDEADEGQEDDLAAGVGVKARHTVGALVVHVLIGNLAAPLELGDDQLALLIGEHVPDPVAYLGSIPYHGHVRLVVVGEVAGAVRVPARYGGHALAGGCRIFLLPAGQPRERQSLGTLHKPP